MLSAAFVIPIRRAAVCLWLLVASCASTDVEPNEPKVDVAWEAGAFVLRIANPLARSIEVQDSGLSDQAETPDGLEVRVLDSAGAVIQNERRDPEGWWTPSFIKSDLTRKPEPMLELRPSSFIERRIPAAQLLWGMRRTNGSIGDMCRLQARATIFHSARRRSITRTTEWMSLACSELFAG